MSSPTSGLTIVAWPCDGVPVALGTTPPRCGGTPTLAPAWALFMRAAGCGVAWARLCGATAEALGCTWGVVVVDDNGRFICAF